MPDEEARIALFIDHENLVIGAREIGRGFDIGPIMDALAERGRVVARRPTPTGRCSPATAAPWSSTTAS